MAKIYTVESPARIHLGFMELDNTAPRLFGSAGLAINKFRNKQKRKNYESHKISPTKSLLNLIYRINKVYY